MDMTWEQMITWLTLEGWSSHKCKVLAKGDLQVYADPTRSAAVFPMHSYGWMEHPAPDPHYRNKPQGMLAILFKYIQDTNL